MNGLKEEKKKQATMNSMTEKKGAMDHGDKERMMLNIEQHTYSK